VEEAPGDILVFLTGQEEIDALGQLLEEKARQLPDGAAGGQELQVLRIYAALPPEQQMKVCGGCCGSWRCRSCVVVDKGVHARG
jgi:ATP-dependent RNA helicase DHX8/PRP22